ncbi:MAG: hypothetical protein E7580_07585 [Ruminococcaceae bacterium]|nr:hypothetical protein [Oscillospiraceae bacterium]
MFQVPSPLQRPDYTFDHTPTVEEMRARAVQAIQDFLNVQWRSHQKIAHNKVGAVSRKRFIYEAENLYAGIPYTDAGMGLFQFFEYYDEETGRLKFYGDGAEFNHSLGGTCACGVCWSLATACSSVSGRFINFYMTPKNGYYPVGDFTVPEDLDDYRNHHTSKIIAEFGEETILEAYTKTHPGDALCSSDRDHTMMIIEEPEVVRDEKGHIIPEESALIIADQRGGNGVGFYDERVEDDLLHHSGRTRFRYPFHNLLKDCYIPVSPAEFQGKKPYERAKITLTAAPENRETLAQTEILSNYPMAIVKLILEKENGSRVLLDRYCFNRNDPHSGLARRFPLLRMQDAILSADGKAILLEVTASNGEILRPAKIEL